MSAKLMFITTLFAVLLTPSVTTVSAHCEIPCGIYDDAMRIDLMEEHIQTIEKSINLIQELSKSADINYNQLVRWINNKDVHANALQDIVYTYFMNQRIKPADRTDKEKYDKYIKELTLLHEIAIHAMKTKQTADLDLIETLRKKVKAFRKSYLGEHGHHH